MTYWHLFGRIFRAADEAAALEEVWDQIDYYHMGPCPRPGDLRPEDFGEVTEAEARPYSARLRYGWFDEPDWLTGGEAVGEALVYYVEDHPHLDDGWYAAPLGGWDVLSGPYETPEEAAQDAGLGGAP